MKHWFLVSLLLALTAPWLLSCSSDDDSTTYDTSKCDITSFAIYGNIYRNLTYTTTTGETVNSRTAYTASGFKFHIDNLKATITSDSLLYGTDLSRARLNIYTNGASVEVKQYGSDEWVVYSNTDSVNLSQPLLVRALDSYGHSRTYTVYAYAHQQKEEDFNWTAVEGIGALQQLKVKQKALNQNLTDDETMLYVFGEDANGVVSVACGSTADLQTSWNLSPLSGITDPMVETAVLNNEGFYMTGAQGMLYRSDDAVNWTLVGTQPAGYLLLASHFTLFALNGGQLLSSGDGGQTWTPNGFDMVAVPETAEAALSYPVSRTSEGDRLVLIGKIEGSNVLGCWNALSKDQPGWVPQWIYAGEMVDGAVSDNPFPCPTLKNLQVIRYNNALFAAGGASEDGKYSAFESFFISRDNGMTWKKTNSIMPPFTTTGNVPTFAMCTDSENYIWLFCDDDIYRGRMNVYGWGQ